MNGFGYIKGEGSIKRLIQQAKKNLTGQALTDCLAVLDDEMRDLVLYPEFYKDTVQDARAVLAEYEKGELEA